MSGKSNNNNLAVAMGLGLELGFMIALPIVGFMLLGLWLDKKIDTMPLFALIGLVIGLISAIVEVVKVIIPFLEKRSQKK